MTGKTWSQGDFNSDGNVNFADLVILAQNYNRSLPAAAAAPLTVQQAPATFSEALKAIGLEGANEARPRPTPRVTTTPRPASGRPAATASRPAFSTLPIRHSAPAPKAKRAREALLD
jgi:hypothetical protein